MKPIVITQPGRVERESDTWIGLFESGLEKLHIRKPELSRDEIKALIEACPKEYHDKLVLHHFPDLAKEFALGGLHLSFEEFLSAEENEIPLSCSVHSWEETRQVTDKAQYVFISPVFDSISKGKYFANKDLQEIPKDLKGKNIIALGGISPDTLGKALEIGYAGVAVLGFVWQGKSLAKDNYSLLKSTILNFNLNGFTDTANLKKANAII